MSEIAAIFETITGVSFGDAVEAAGNPHKEAELMGRIMMNARNVPDVFRDACAEMVAIPEVEKTGGRE